MTNWLLRPRAISLYAVSALLILWTSTVEAAPPDYLKLGQLYQYLDSNPELFADADKARFSFCDISNFKATEKDAERHAALSQQDKVAAKKWLSDFASTQALFGDEALEKVAKRLEIASDADAQVWYREIVSVRLLADTEEWQITNAWLAQFWKVQAMYKDDQIKTLQGKLQRLSPVGVGMAMEHFMSVLGKRAQRRVTAPRQPLRMVAPTQQALRYTSGAPSGSFTPQAPVQTPRRNRNLSSGQISRRVSQFYIYRGSLLY